MIGFPNAKINIGLRITDKLPDGYHQLKSLMIPVKFCDILEFIKSDKDSLHLTGNEIAGKNKDNILWKVLQLIREEHPIPPLHIHLHKIIPSGAGLGGGSSDAAFLLNMVDEYFRLNITLSKKEQMIARAGSDCPFFIRNRPAIISGTGTILNPFEFNPGKLYVGIVFPGYGISTAKAYAGVKIQPEKKTLEELLKENISKWKDTVINDFESSLFPVYRDLKKIKSEFYNCGAIYSSLSGSGSAIYGLFKEKPVFSPLLKKILVYEGFLNQRGY